MYNYQTFKKGGEDNRSQPSQNMKFNDVYLNELIDGYRQLNVAGRHLISRDLDLVKVPYRDGKWFNDASLEPREIVVNFQLIATDSNDMRQKMAKLNKLLNTNELVPIVFDDEPLYTYFGTFSYAPNDNETRLSIVSSFTLICPTPFKFKLKQTSVNGQIPTLEQDNILPDKLVARVTTNTQRVEILNGARRIVFDGNYLQNDTITITWGDEVDAKHNQNNALMQIQQFGFPTAFTINSGDVVRGINCTISLIEWRDRRL